MNEEVLRFARTSTKASQTLAGILAGNRYWQRLRVFARVIGKFMRVRREIFLFGMNYVKQDIADVREDEVMKRNKSCFKVFRPDSTFLKLWHVLTFLLLIYTSIILPLSFCFPKVFNMNWVIVDTVIDFIFLFDILVTINTAIPKQKGDWVTNRRQIFKAYLKGWFFIDFISCLPLQLLDVSSVSTSNKYLRFIRVNRVYRIARLLKILRFTKVSNKSLKILMFKQFNDIEVFNFVLVTYIFVHNLACLWILVSGFEDYTEKNMFLRYNLETSSTFDIYLYSVYYIFTTLTTIGYGDIIPFTNEEKMFAILVMAFGIGFYSLLIARLTRILTSIDSRENLVKSKIKYFNDFSKVIDLPEEFIIKVRNHIVLNSYKHYYLISEIDFLNHIPLTLREEVSSYLHQVLIGKIDFFRSKKSNFLHEIIPKLKKSHFFKSEIIYYTGEEPEEIYFIESGQVGLKLENFVFRIYHQGSYFGEIELIENTLRLNSSFCQSLEVEVFILMKKDFFAINENFPDVFEEISICAKERKKRNQEALDKTSYSIFRDIFIESSSEMSAGLSGQSASRDARGFRNERRDTEVLISVKNDNEAKKRNRKLWSHAIEGTRKGEIYRRAKTLKRSLSIIGDEYLEGWRVEGEEEEEEEGKSEGEEEEEEEVEIGRGREAEGPRDRRRGYKRRKRNLELLNDKDIDDLILEHKIKIEKKKEKEKEKLKLKDDDGFRRVRVFKFRDRDKRDFSKKSMIKSWMHDSLFLRFLLEPMGEELLQSITNQLKTSNLTETSAQILKDSVFTFSSTQKKFQSSLLKLENKFQFNLC